MHWLAEPSGASIQREPFWQTRLDEAWLNNKAMLTRHISFSRVLHILFPWAFGALSLLKIEIKTDWNVLAISVQRKKINDCQMYYSLVWQGYNNYANGVNNRVMWYGFYVQPSEPSKSHARAPRALEMLCIEPAKACWFSFVCYTHQLQTSIKRVLPSRHYDSLPALHWSPNSTTCSNFCLHNQPILQLSILLSVLSSVNWIDKNTSFMKVRVGPAKTLAWISGRQVLLT